MVLAFVFLSLFDTFSVLTGQFCNSQEGCRQLKFEPAHISQGKRLTTHVIRTEDVMDGDFCQALCYMEPNCVSYNLRVKASNDGKYKCELNNSTIEGKPDKLEANPDYVYRGTKDKCLNNLCERHSTCQTGFTKKGYHCLCSAGFTGPYCETDIDECAFDATCSPNANCENTFGSYICNCNPEYYGDGKNCEQAHSCKEIYDRNILIDNGAYSLKVGGQTIDVYCHMKATADENACGDGGWTLVMKTDGTKQTFLYDSSLWDNQMSHDVQAGKTGFDNEETKLPTYWNTPFSKICLAMKTAGANNINFIILNMKASSLYSLIADGRHRQTNLSHLAWRSLIGPGANLLNYCNKEGFNVRSIVNDRARARIGIISNDADNCDRCNSRIGFGTAGESNAYTCGFMLFTKGLAAMGYIFVN